MSSGTRMPASEKSAANQAQWSTLPPVTGPCIAQVRHDSQCANIRGGSGYPYLSRFYDQNQVVRGLPESVRYQGGKGHASYPQAWINFFHSKNTAEAISYLERPQSGYRNYGTADEFEQVTWGGAYVAVYRVDGNKAYINSYNATKQPTDTDYSNVNYLQLFSVVYTDDSISGPPCGNAYTLVMAGQPDELLWIDVSDLFYLRALSE